MIEEQLHRLRNLTAVITEEGLSQERLQQVIKAIKIELTEARYRFDGVYLPVGPVIDGCVEKLSSTTSGAKTPTFDGSIEELQRLVEEIGPPPPDHIKINTRMLTQLRAIVPFCPTPSWESLYGVDVEIDDTVPDGMMKVGNDVLSLGKQGGQKP